MAKEIRKLGDLATLEVSLVTKGANRKRFALTKSEEELNMDPIIEAVLKSDLDGEDKVAAILKREGYSDKGAKAFTALFKLAKGFEDELPKAVIKQLAEACGVELTEKAFPPKKEDEEDTNMDPKAKKKFEAMQKSLEDRDAKFVALQKQLDNEREERRTREFVAKAAEFKSIPGIKTEELGMVLKSVTDSAPDHVAKLEAVLKAAEKAITEGELLRQAGVPGAGVGGGDAWGQIEKMADGIVQKSDKPMSKADAIDLVLKTDSGKTLMAQYERENPRQYGVR